MKKCFTRARKDGSKYQGCTTKPVHKKKAMKPKKKKKPPVEYKPKRKINVPPRKQPTRMAKSKYKK